MSTILLLFSFFFCSARFSSGPTAASGATAHQACWGYCW